MTFLGALMLAATTAVSAMAQAPVVDSSAARHMRFDGGALRGGQYVYEMTLERDAATGLLGVRTVSATPSTYAGTPAWLLLETRTGPAGFAVDSLFTDFAGLHPLHWSAMMGSARLAAEFRGDTAYGATSSPIGRRSTVSVIPTGSFVSGAMLEMALRLMPLQPIWEDSATVVSTTLGGTTVLPARLSVIGEDRVRVPAGTFDCWVVSLRADPARGMYWVTKRDPIVVRSVVDVPSMGGAQMVSALLRIGR